MKYETILFDRLHGASQIQVPIPQRYRDCIKLIQSDYFRVYGATATIFRIWLTGFRNHCIQYQLWWRLSAYRKGWLFPFFKWRQEHYSKLYGLDIPPSTRVGWGFYIGHGIAIVIARTATIGNNVNISQGCSIGSNNGEAARIGDNVYIGPNVCIVEDVQIGSDTIVGAGSVVVKSLEQGCTAVGSPCKEVGENRHPEYIRNRWQLDADYS